MRLSPIRLLFVDDHKVVRLGLRALFETVEQVVVVGEAATAAEAIQLAQEARPDIVLLDVRLPDENGITVCREIRSLLPETRVIMLTSYSDDDAVVGSVLAGAAGYFLKQTDPERLIEAIEVVARGGSLLDAEVTRVVLDRVRVLGDEVPSDPVACLSTAERDVLRLIAEGKTNREIAAALFLSEHTVKSYVSNILQKLHLSRRAEAAAFIASYPR